MHINMLLLFTNVAFVVSSLQLDYNTYSSKVATNLTTVQANRCLIQSSGGFCVFQHYLTTYQGAFILNTYLVIFHAIICTPSRKLFLFHWKSVINPFLKCIVMPWSSPFLSSFFIYNLCSLSVLESRKDMNS